MKKAKASPRKTVSRADRQRAMAAAAMPDVKRMVKRFGRVAVANCIAKLRDVEKQANKIATMQKEISALRRKLR